MLSSQVHRSKPVCQRQLGSCRQSNRVFALPEITCCVRSRFTKPDSRVYLTRAFYDLHGGHIEVQGPFHPYIPCSLAAQQPREYLIREPLVVDAPLACVWCAGHRPHLDRR